MINKDALSENNFMMYAMKNYTNSQCMGMEEFEEDINRIKYIKRLLSRFDKKGILKERLLLNHIIIMGNVFGPIPTSRILFYKIENHLHSYLKSFLLFLEYLPEITFEIPEVELNKIPVDIRIVKRLREV
jgi:hypothetical protein